MVCCKFNINVNLKKNYKLYKYFEEWEFINLKEKSLVEYIIIKIKNMIFIIGIIYM